MLSAQPLFRKDIKSPVGSETICPTEFAASARTPRNRTRMPRTRRWSFGNELEAKLPITRFTVIHIVCPTVSQISATRWRRQRKKVTPQRCSPLRLQGSASPQRDLVGWAGGGRGNGLWRLPEGTCSNESLLLRVP